MVKEVRIIYKAEAEIKESQFWKEKSYEEKLSVVQFLREQYLKLFNKQDDYAESRKKLRRVYRIIN